MAAASGAGSKTGATLFLEPKNRIVEQYMANLLDVEEEVEAAHLEVGDFDDTTITLSNGKEAPVVATATLEAPYLTQIKAAGAFGPAETALGKYLQPSSDGVVLSVDTSALPEAPEAVVDTFARITREVVGAPYTFLLDHLAAGTITSAAPFAVNFRGGECTYFLPGPGRVTFGYGLHFPDKTDAALVRVMCTQFGDVQRTMGSAPAVAFAELGATGQVVPRELQDSGLPLLTPAEGEGFTGYITLTFFPSHVDSPAKVGHVTNLVSTFRSFLNYHLKASKSYIHSRMRTRVNGLLQVLNRAQASDPTKPKVKKTFQGKTLKAKA